MVRFLLTSKLFSATLEVMENVDQHVSPQSKVSNYKIRLLIFSTLLSINVVSGMVGYLLGEKGGNTYLPRSNRSSLQVALIPSVQPTITKLPTSTPMIVRSETTETPALTPIIPSSCSGKDIKATVFWNAAAGEPLGAITYVNTSSSACLLLGYPTILLKDSAGSFYQTQISHESTNYYEISDPRQGILQPNTKNSIQSDFGWSGCVSGPKGVIEVYITLPHDATQFFAANDPNDGFTSYTITPMCSDNITPTNQSWLYISPFEAFNDR